MQESLVIAACQRADSVAQRTLYESYLPYVLTIVRRFGFAEQEVPDVIQEIFIEVFYNIKKYDAAKGEFKYWLKSIAIHKILKMLRQRKRTDTVHLDDFQCALTTDEIDLQEMDTEYLIRLIGELPDGYRTVFNLYVVDGYSHEEIASLLGIDAGSSRSQLSRAKQVLKKKIQQFHKGDCYGII